MVAFHEHQFRMGSVRMIDCQNIEHKKPCSEEKQCSVCGTSTCSPNYAYHVCYNKDGDKMSYTDLIKKGICPNGCGKLTTLKHPLKIVLLIPEDLLDHIPEGADEDYYGAIRAICLECGFNLVIGTRDDEN